MPRDKFYSSKEWRALRKQALVRDGYKCVMCGIDVSGWKKSRVDHILTRRERPDLELVLDNLRSLCVTCDNRRHAEKFGREEKHPDPVAEDGFSSDEWR